MKKACKLFLFALVLMAIILIPNFCKAATTHNAATAAEFAEKISQAETGDTISLDANIELTGPIEISDKSLTINGNGHIISRDESWSVAQTNATFITIGGEGNRLTLNDLTLTGSLKYGVQAFNGGHVILNDVTISNCAYAGVLVNGGTLEIIDLKLGHNHSPESNVGIEIGMAADVTVTPTIIMNGAITTEETENVLYIAENDELTTFDVENTDSSEQKIFVQGNQVVVTNSENQILFTSNETEVDIAGTEFVENKTITVYLNDKTFSFTMPENTVLTRKALEERINLATLNLSNYEISGYYTSPEFETEFDFDKPILEDTAIYAKLSSTATAPAAPKDETPKTGDTNFLGVAIATLSIIAVGITLFKRSDVRY